MRSCLLLKLQWLQRAEQLAITKKFENRLEAKNQAELDTNILEPVVSYVE